MKISGEILTLRLSSVNESLLIVMKTLFVDENCWKRFDMDMHTEECSLRFVFICVNWLCRDSNKYIKRKLCIN